MRIECLIVARIHIERNQKDASRIHMKETPKTFCFLSGFSFFSCGLSIVPPPSFPLWMNYLTAPPHWVRPLCCSQGQMQSCDGLSFSGTRKKKEPIGNISLLSSIKTEMELKFSLLLQDSKKIPSYTLQEEKMLYLKSILNLIFLMKRPI